MVHTIQLRSWAFLGGCLLRSFPPPYFEFGRKQSISICYLDGFYGFWWVHKNSIWYPIKILIFLEFPQLPHPPTPTLLKSFTFNIWLSPKNYIFYDPKVCYIRHCSEIEKASCRDFYPPPDEFDKLTYDNTPMKHITFS